MRTNAAATATYRQRAGVTHEGGQAGVIPDVRQLEEPPDSGDVTVRHRIAERRDVPLLVLSFEVAHCGSISTSTNPLDSSSIRSRSVRNGCGFANDLLSNSPNLGTSAVFLLAFLNASA